ncbi:MAG: type I secretion system permease/ATPase [Steroidobacteraceae bacterium]|nr:type I secretion system permease/ATPase [Steroidobacteraceae bacterium]
MNSLPHTLGLEPGGDDPLLGALRLALAHHGIERSPDALLAGLPAAPRLTPELFVRAARAAGCNASVARRSLADIHALLLPVVLVLREGGAVLLLARGGDGADAEAPPAGPGAASAAASPIAPGVPWCEIAWPEMGGARERIALAELESRYAGACFLLKPAPRPETRSGLPGPRPAAGGHWFWGTLWRYRGYYGEAAFAAVLANVLTLAGTFFVMNVYDRVIANQAYVTLWTLAVGVTVAIGFEFAARSLRGWLIDSAGKKADLVIGARLFQHALATRLEHQPASPGAFASHLREFESVRDFASSLTLVTLTDLPFLALFLAVIVAIAGPLAWVPIALIPLVALVTGLAQIPLARYVGENLREASLRQGLLVESLAVAETLKALRAEGLMQGRYEHASAATAATAMKSRLLTQVVLNFCAAMQSLTTVVMVVWGAYLIGEGRLTIGALIGAVMLASRSLAPVGSLAGLAVRWQQARSALRTLDALMARPADRDPARDYLAKPVAEGALQVRGLAFGYAPDRPPAIRGLDWAVARGERVAILGRIGSGKSTLLKLLCGLYQPRGGQVLLDGIDLQQVDPADARRHLAYVGQEAQLLHGTLRENLKAGAPQAGDARMIEVARATGVDALAAQHPRGYDMPIGEKGAGLSGGQRQLIALTRALLAEPAVLLLDEPTSAMDNATEQQLMQAIVHFTAGRSLVLVTHKLQLLAFVERVMVMDGGRCVADGPKQAVMQALSEGRVRAAS